MVHIFKPERYVQVTAEILFALPDFPSLRQTYTWQADDLDPEFPNLKGFLKFWRRELYIAPIVEVRVAHTGLIKPADLRMYAADKVLWLN